MRVFVRARCLPLPERLLTDTTDEDVRTLIVVPGELTDAAEWEAAVRDTDQARGASNLHTRNDLGARGGKLPAPSWPSSRVPSNRLEPPAGHESVSPAHGREPWQLFSRLVDTLTDGETDAGRA